jgi:hypothetical protein
MTKPTYVPPPVTPRSTGDFRVIPESPTPRASVAIDAALAARTTQPGGVGAQPDDANAYQAPALHRAVTDGDLRDAMELDEFLTQLGVVLRLPPRRPTGSSLPVIVTLKPRSWGISVLAVCALFLAVIGALRLLPPRTDPLPDALIGVWETWEPEYAGRRFEIKPTSLVLQTGEGIAAHRVFSIDNVRRGSGANTTWYTITYDDDGTPQTFVVSAQEGGAVRVKNQRDIVWRKVR